MKILIIIFLLTSHVFHCFSQNSNETSVESTILGRGEGKAYAFPFFYGKKGMDTLGMWMAISKNGLDWEVVNNNKVLFQRPFGERFRDPAIYKDSTGLFHLVFTTAIKNTTCFGYAQSKDLINWTNIKEISIMDSIKGTVNVWAPEIFYDTENKRWMVYWASSVRGRYPETKQKHSIANNRMYYSFTTDFENFTEPKILYDKHIVNDTRIVNTNSKWGKYCMVVKHIMTPGTSAELYLTYSNSIEGPYKKPNEIFEYITNPYKFCEGPAIIKIEDYYYCYFDLSREHRMACKRSKAIEPGNWEDMTDKLTFPEEVKHGDIVRIPMSIYNSLKCLDINKK